MNLARYRSKIFWIATLLSLVGLFAGPAFAGDAAQCIRYLRDIAYNETIVKTSSDVKETLRYAMCKSDFKTRSEAQKGGFSLGITLFDIPFNAEGDLDTAKFEQWKSTNCIDLSTGFSAEQESSTLIRVVSPEAVSIFNSCVSDSGLFCSISSPSPDLINIQLNWTPYPGSKAYTTLRSSTVVNARSIEPKTPTGQLAPVKYVIPYGGVIVQLQRDDVRRAVNVTVNTDNGACPPLTVSAEGDVTAQVEFSGKIERKVIKVEAKSVLVENAACGTTQQQSVDICGSVAAESVTIQNESSTCGFTPSQATVAAGCAKVATQVTGCAFTPRSSSHVECWVEGINHSKPRRVCQEYLKTVQACEQRAVYSATAQITGTVWETVDMQSVVTTKTGRNGNIAFIYDMAPYSGAEYRNPRISYKAVISYPGPDGRIAIGQVSEAVPTLVAGKTMIRSAFNALDSTLLIFVESDRSLSNAQHVNEAFLINSQPQFTIQTQSENVEEFDLDAYNAQTLETIELNPVK